jgi:hypothetical protein
MQKTKHWTKTIAGHNSMLKLCPDDAVLEVFWFLSTLVQLDTEVLLIGHNINTKR